MTESCRWKMWNFQVRNSRWSWSSYSCWTKFWRKSMGAWYKHWQALVMLSCEEIVCWLLAWKFLDQMQPFSHIVGAVLTTHPSVCVWIGNLCWEETQLLWHLGKERQSGCWPHHPLVCWQVKKNKDTSTISSSCLHGILVRFLQKKILDKCKMKWNFIAFTCYKLCLAVLLMGK